MPREEPPARTEGEIRPEAQKQPYEPLASALTPDIMPGFEGAKAEAAGVLGPGRAQFQQEYGFELSLQNLPRVREGILSGAINPKVVFPEFAEEWTKKHDTTLRVLLEGLERNSPQVMLKGVKLWAKLMLKEATP